MQAVTLRAGTDMNLQLLRGVADSAGDSRYLVELDPGPGHSCVRLRPAVQ